MASEIRVNKIENRSGLGTVTFADTGVDLAGIVTATTFSGSGASLTNLPAGNLSGTLPAISAANLTNVPAANITGTLPAISAANLTNVPAANITGTLPALTAANLTNVPAANIVGVATAGFERTGGFSDYVKIATGTWSSAVASVSVDNLDTTTYKYFVMLWNSVPEVDNSNLRFKWRLDGSDTTAASYDWAAGTTYGYSTTGTVQNEEYAKVCLAMGNTAWEGCQLEFVIYPKSSAESGYQGNSVIVNGFYNTNSTSPRSSQAAAFYDGGTTYYPNGFKLYQSAGNLNTGDYAIYGVKR